MASPDNSATFEAGGGSNTNISQLLKVARRNDLQNAPDTIAARIHFQERKQKKKARILCLFCLFFKIGFLVLCVGVTALVVLELAL